MRFLIVNRPKHLIPPEMVVGMIDAAKAWQERYANEIEQVGLFAGGGGFGIVNVDDDATLHRMSAEMPFTATGDFQITPFVDSATGWDTAREVVAAMAQRGAG